MYDFKKFGERVGFGKKLSSDWEITVYFNQYHLVANSQNPNLKKKHKSKLKREKNIPFSHELQNLDIQVEQRKIVFL